jgi:hypothetical protein
MFHTVTAVKTSMAEQLPATHILGIIPLKLQPYRRAKRKAETNSKKAKNSIKKSDAIFKINLKL